MSAGRKIQYRHLRRPGEKPEKIALDQELKSGGAGTVYSIKGNPDLVIKIYHDEVLASDEGEIYRGKIECMLVNAPNVPDVQTKNGSVVQLAWPVASAYTLQGTFVGFAMPTVDFQRTIELEYALTERQAKQFGLRHDLEARIYLAHNLAAVVSSINARGHALVDLKPVNLMFYKEVLCLAVVDCDGFFINVPGKVGSAPQVTLEYLAPEFQPKLPSDKPNVTVPEHQDRFALAVVVFQLLNNGIHPFGGIPGPNENIPTGKEACIRDGLYPYGISPHKKIHPVQASVHEAFPQELRELFDRAFAMRPAMRPSSDEWHSALKKYLDKSKKLLEHCPNGHLQFSGMPCLSCLREQILSSAASAKRTAQISSSASFSAPATRAVPAPHPQVAARHPQVLAASSFGNLQQAVSPPHHTQSQAPAQSVATGSSLLERILATEYAVPHIILFVASLIAGFFIGVKFWFALIFIAIILYKYQTDDRDGLWPRSWHSLYGGVCLSGLIFAGIWTYGYYYADSKSGEIAITTENEKSPQVQSDAKQEPPQDSAPHPVTWPDTWPKAAPHTDPLPTNVDTPVAQETPQIAVQESINRSNSDRIPVAGSTVGQANENASGARGWLGVDAQPLTSELVSSMNLGSSRGMLVNDVANGGPADMAGMVAGDLLVSIDNKPVDTKLAFRDVLSTIPVGRTVPIKIIREGSEKYLVLKMGQMP